MEPTDKRLAECQRIIGYHFASTDLLRVALTHSSLRSPDRECNERLEFLGDSVLGLVITEELYRYLPDSSEGELTRIKSAVVSRGALFRTSKRLGLPQFAEYARGVGRRDELPTSVVANLVESVIGAIYLDAGYYPAREFVLRHIGAEIEDVLHDRGAKNYKSLLQHEVQQGIGVTPHYRTIEEEGPDHCKEFTVAAVIQGREWGRAAGANKKAAEQDAAKSALEKWERRGRGRRRRRRKKAAANASEADAQETAVQSEGPLDRATETPAGEPAASDDASVGRKPKRRKRSRARTKSNAKPNGKPSAKRNAKSSAKSIAPEPEAAADVPAPELDSAAPAPDEKPRSPKKRAARKKQPTRVEKPAAEAASDTPAAAAEVEARAKAPPPPPASDGFAAGIDVPKRKPAPKAKPRKVKPSRKVPAKAKAPSSRPPRSDDDGDDFGAGLE